MKRISGGPKLALAIGIIIILLMFALIGGIWAANSWVTIKQGEAILIVDATKSGEEKVSEPILGPVAGFYVDGFKRMIGQQYIVKIYYATDSVSMWTEWKQDASGRWVEADRGDYPAIKTLSKDGLEIEVDILVRWSLNPNGLKALYLKYPNLNWKDIAINSIIREEVRDTISHYTAIQVIENREVIANALSQAIKEGLLEDETINMVIQDIVVDLRDIDPSLEFVSAIEKKLAAEQAKIQAMFEYERQITLAKAEAESKIIIANGTKEAINTIVSITGETNATRIAELYLTLEAMKTIAPNTKQFIIIFGQGTPIVYPIQPEP
ncbi:MAG: SPFH domain-containing protein [Candidatus Bathyarchaeia archaeon]